MSKQGGVARVQPRPVPGRNHLGKMDTPQNIFLVLHWVVLG